MKWEDYARRRKLNIKSWLQSKGITDLSTMLSYLSSINVEVGNVDEIRKLFTDNIECCTIVSPEPIVIEPTASFVTKGRRARKK
jgi:hypothetical protein